MKYDVLRSKSRGLWYTIEKYARSFRIVKVYLYKYAAEYEADKLTKEQNENRITK